MLELASGTSLGAYVITARIGRGGMASVYQAHHPALDRNVAIKVLWESLADQPGFLERFRREARAASRLRHPNILTVYDFGEDGGIAYMVTELLPGGTLADRLGAPLQYTEVLRVLRGIGSALDAAHEAGLIHRDVKPSNILFTRDGEPVLADFGIARLTESEENLTVQGTLIGTPHYMAPEMASGEEVGKSSDLYSLGVVLYEMLAGEPPFPRPTPIAVVRAHIHEPPPPLPQPVPEAVDAVVARALSKQPAQRYRSGAALAAAFEEAILAGDPPTPRPGSVPVWGGQQYADTARQPPPPESNTADMPPWVEPSPTSGVEAPTRERPAYTSFDAYDAVIPGPPGGYNASPAAYTDRWPQATPVPRRRGGPGRALAIIAAIALLVTAGAFFARSSDLASRLGLAAAATATPPGGAVVTITPAPATAPAKVTTPGPGTPPAGIAASPAPIVGASPAASPVAATSPVAAASPTALTLPTPTAPPTATPQPPTATPDPRRGPLAVQFSSPADGATVPARPPIAGRRTGLQGPDEHLWMLIHPDGGPDNWWPYKQELIADRDGAWRIDDVEIGGPAGSRHVLAIGVADASTHQAILAQIKEHQDEPFVGGQPQGFRELTRVTVTKR
jgi:serine/threonine-protein kinase